MILQFQPNALPQYHAAQRWCDKETVEIAFGGAKYGGKSFLGANLIFHDALVYPETRYFIAREKLNDLRKFTLPTIHEAFKKWNISFDKYCRYNGQDNFFKCYNGSEVLLLECKELPGDPMFERFGSSQFTRGWIEEGGEVSELAKENLRISIGRWKNSDYNLPEKLLITCNPKKNWLYRDFYKPFKSGTLSPDRAFIRSLPTDNISKGNQRYIQMLSEMKNPQMRARLYEGDWEYEDDPRQLCGYDKIIDIFTNQHVTAGIKYITADIARFGKDTTRIFVWSGWRVEKIFTITKSSIADTAAAIRSIATTERIPMSNVLCDEDGIGGGVVDILKCCGFIANSIPLILPLQQEKYRGLKAQCGYYAAARINSAEVYVQCDDGLRDDIVQELEQLKAKEVDNDTTADLMPKEKIKKEIGRSPDLLDNIIMRSFFDLRDKTSRTRFPEAF